MPPPKQKSVSVAPGIPDFRDDIAKWNAAWEARFPVLNSTVGNLETLVAGSLSSPASAQQDLVHNYHTMRRLCRVQEQLRAFAVTSVLQPNFCWKGLTPAARKAHMLEGLLRTCSIEPIYGPNSRMLTCDITLSSLESGNGEGFLTLLRRYVPDGEVSVSKGGGISYPHPGWTDEAMGRLQSAGHEVEVQGRVAARDEFLSAFLHHTISSVIGVILPSEAVKSDSTRKKLTSESPNAVPVYRLARACDGCQSEERSDAQFSVCKKCNENVSRKVYYCSRPCQVSDWPSHKKICGKALTCAIVKDVTLYTEASLAEAVLLLRRIGPAHNGYARSAALVRQITYLDATPSRDYVFFTSMGPQPVGIPKFLRRFVFRLTVQTAMATGDPGCIAAVMEMLVPALTQQHEFVHQLVQEYGETGASAIKLVQAQLSAPCAGEAVTRWENEFLRTESGSCYVDVADKPSEVSPLEVTRRVIKDLREWWSRRSSKPGVPVMRRG
ncbi:hypothetical protein FB451DRAFT_1570700 [Mycena latifolia]|nr:hypothetical protein FB451DRAFT_1570700 [Mycena latifolia]